MQSALAKSSVRTPSVASRAVAKKARTVVVRAQQDNAAENGFAKALLATAAAATVGLSAGGADAFPIFAQQNYANPREANGRIVCANCHLAQKPVELEMPQAVLPDTVFEATIKIPYDKSIQQVAGNGKKGALNVGAVLIMPEGFKLAPEERIPEELKEKMNGINFIQYSPEKPNIYVVGPVPGEKYSEMHLPILSPDPASNKSVGFLKYTFYLGGNRGRGQVYPDGSKSNNTVYNASKAGTVTDIQVAKKATTVSITTESGDVVQDKFPNGPELLVSVGDVVKQDQPLTNNPNVGGFGQEEVEVVLQDSNRIFGMLAFFAGALLTQVMLVLKKKQFEKVQLAEMNF